MAKASKPKPAPEELEQVETENANLHYEEWRIEKKAGKLEKIKKLRDKVKIPEETANTLNSGFEGQQNVDYGIMYFLPE